MPTLCWVDSLDGSDGLDGAESPEQSLRKAIEWLQKAIDLDDTIGLCAHPYWASSILCRGSMKRPLPKRREAVALDPNGADAMYLWHDFTVLAGGTKKPLRMLKKAIRLNPFPPAGTFTAWGSLFPDREV